MCVLLIPRHQPRPVLVFLLPPLIHPPQAIRPSLPPLPEELRRHICSYLPEIVDLVRLSMVSKGWCIIARGHETKDRRPIFTDQAGVEEVWPHLPFGKVYGGHGGEVDCVHADGGYLYTGCGDGRARKTEVETGEVCGACGHGMMWCVCTWWGLPVHGVCDGGRGDRRGTGR